MAAPSAFENISLAVQLGALDLTSDKQNVTYISVQTSTQRNSTRLDWILYTVPTAAFLLGLYLFSLILIKHRRREERIMRVERLSQMKHVQCRLNGSSTESAADDEEDCKVRPKKAQSYENVGEAVYSTQEELSLTLPDHTPEADGDDYVIPDAERCESIGGRGEMQNDPDYHVPTQNLTDTDYVTPDAERCEIVGGRGEMQNDPDYLTPPQNLTDTDGESYENMESSLFPQPRRPTDTDSQDGDYIDPTGIHGGQVEGDCNHLTDTDESYENMDSPAYSLHYSHSDPCRPLPATAVQEEEEDDSYMKMESII